MDKVAELVTNVTSMAFHALDLVEEHTGFPPVVFFTIVALVVGAYFLISGLLVPSQITAPPPSSTATLGDILKKPFQVGEITALELSEYGGGDAGKPLLMAIKGQVYDVSSARDFYGPGGPYSVFAGKDASRALARMTFEDKDLCGDLEGLSETELETLKEWEDRFSSKYTKVGVLKPELTSTKEAKAETTPSSRNEGDEEQSREVSTVTTSGGEGTTTGESQDKGEAEERGFEMVDKVKGLSSEGEESGVTSSLEGTNAEKDETTTSSVKDEGLSNQSATAAAI